MRHACRKCASACRRVFPIVAAPEENHRHHSSKRDRREADELRWLLAAKVSASIATADRTSPDQHGFTCQWLFLDMRWLGESAQVG